MEQYVEAIASLLRDDKVCSISDIAAEANVSRPAASRAVRDLAARNLVAHRAYGYVDLTPAGHALANRLDARHKALRDFFSEILGLDHAYSDEEACRLEHQIGDTIVDRIVTLTGIVRDAPDVARRLDAAFRSLDTRGT